MQQLGRSVERRRQRELAGAARAGSWARGRARTEQRAFLRANWVRLTVFILGALVLGVAVAWTMPSEFLSGVVVGASLVAVPGSLWWLAVQLTGTAPTMMGDEAEQWTASELRRLSREGWRLVNHLALRTDDIDHVLLGPGGAYAIETKWSSSWEGTYGQQRIRHALAQARDNARALSLWHPLKSLEIMPSPVLVLWGPGLSNWDERRRVRSVDGVSIVVGPALRDWIGSLGQGGLTEEQVSKGWWVLEEHIARRDPTERALHPVPMSVAEWAGRLALAVGFSALGLAAFGQILHWTQSVALTLLLVCALILPFHLLLRSALLRWVVWSWSIGLGLPCLALIAAEAITFAR